MKKDELLKAINSMYIFFYNFEALVVSEEGYYDQQSIILQLVEEANRLGIDGLPKEYLRQCIQNRKKPAL